jgi:glycerol uptake facilitator-like aquaporin
VRLWRRFLLVFIGTGAIVMYKIQAGPKPELLPIALAWAFAIVVIVYAFGHVSGAHVNPSVTLGLAVTRKFPWKAVPAYLGAQFVGMTLASLSVLVIFGHQARLHTIAMGATMPAVGLGVGLAVGGLILCTANVTGTSLNPMRTLVPMLVSGYFPAWAAYVVGPLLGAVVGALLYEHIIRSGSPPEPAGAVEEHPRGEL